MGSLGQTTRRAMFKFLILISSSSLCFGSPLEGFGDATDEEIAQIRAGTYLEMFDENPSYTFNYKVADSDEQTYVAMEESRADNVVTGTYSYVDPLGSLITVTYTAGPMGYTETREVQEGFVKISQKPPKNQGSSSGSGPQSVAVAINPSGPLSGSSGSSSSGFSSTAFGSSFGSPATFPSSSGTSSGVSGSASSSSSFQSEIVSAVVSQVQPLISQTVSSAVSGQESPSSASLSSTSSQSTSSSSLSQSDLIASILTQLQPLISESVSSIVGSSLSTSGQSSTISSRPTSQTSSATSTPVQNTVQGLFGTGGDFNVRINTP